MAATRLRIAQVANFYGPQSGGLRTTVDMLGEGYLAAGCDRLLVVPGDRDRDEQTPAGRRITLDAPRVPGGGGYRWLPDWRLVAAVLGRVGADRLEVSDKLTLWRLGPWATRRQIPAVLLSHERIDAILAPRLPRWAATPAALTALADRRNRRLAAAFPTVVAASAFSCEEWHRVGATNVLRISLGVDLTTFRPGPDRAPASTPAPADLVCVGRLSREKRPDLALGALEALVAAGVAARLTMIGAGPEGRRLAAWAEKRRLPVEFTGHLAGRHALSSRLASADVVLAPCPVEAFGLVVLESLACGTPVVTCDQGAAGELLAPGCGATAAPRPDALAAAVTRVLAVLTPASRRAARQRAEHYPWSATVAAMLAAHQVAPAAEAARCA